MTFDPANGNLIANGFVSLEFNALRSVACLPASGGNQCTAVDTAGNEVTFNPTAPTAQTATLIEAAAGTPAAIACPTASECTVVDNNGAESTFNPASPGSPAPAAVDTAGDAHSSGGQTRPSGLDSALRARPF